MHRKNSDELITQDLTVNEEHALIKAFINGNPDAFTLLYKRYVNDLFAYGMGLCFERETVKDAIQEVFYKLHKSKKHLKEVTSLKHYLLRMLKNHLFDVYRSKTNSSEITSYELSFSVKTTILDEIISQEEQALLQTRIDNLLKLLTDRQREAIYLRFIQELEYEEIGELLNMTPQASRKLVSRAVKRMREEDPTTYLIIVLLYFC